MNAKLMMKNAISLAGEIGAIAVVSFLPRLDCEAPLPIVWVEDLQLDVLKDMTMQDLLDVSERHLTNAAVHLYLSRTLEEGTVVGVFPHAIVLFDLREGNNFINVKEFEEYVPRDVMHAVLTLAMEIAVEGREGRSIGTAFIIGDGMAILQHSHQAILNPFEGQSPEVCNIMNRNNWESIKEFAQIDGVFVVNFDGQVLSAGRYLDVSGGDLQLPGGLGGRHRAAAAITKLLPVVGVTISESGGMVRIFQKGRLKLSIRSDIRITAIQK